jgi:hypothetical protein
LVVPTIGVVEVLSSLGDLAGSLIVEFLALVTGDDPARAQGLDNVDGFAPCIPAAIAGLGEVLVDAVIHHVAGYDEAEVGHVEDAGFVGITVTDVDDDEVMVL